MKTGEGERGEFLLAPPPQLVIAGKSGGCAVAKTSLSHP